MKYNIIYADPAWKFNNKNTGGSMSSGSQSQYTVTSIEDMKSLNVGEIAADNCILIMWWVGAMPQEALDLAESWGFTVKNMNGFVWRKLTKNLKDFFGMGFYTRAGSESALIATKGKVKINSHSIRAVQSLPVSMHSEKPEKFKDLIIELCGDLPRIELFSRKKSKGFDVWGDQVESDVIL